MRTRQLLLIILVVLVAVLVRRYESAGLGIACSAQLTLPCFSALKYPHTHVLSSRNSRQSIARRSIDV